MARRKQLGKRQFAVMDDIFAGQLDEQAVLDKYEVSRNVYNKWQTDEQFVREFDRRIAVLNRQGELIIARYAALAAAKLVALTESENQETARKACLDIISLPRKVVKRADRPTEPAANPNEQPRQLPPGTASRLLAALAEEKNGG